MTITKEAAVAAVKVLTEAKRLLREVGWCKDYICKSKTGVEISFRRMYDSPEIIGSYCAVGAIDQAAVTQSGNEYDDISSVAYDAVRKIITNQFTPKPRSIPDWNDTRDSVDEVIEVFDKAIDYLATTSSEQELIRLNNEILLLLENKKSNIKLDRIALFEALDAFRFIIRWLVVPNEVEAAKLASASKILLEMLR